MKALKRIVGSLLVVGALSELLPIYLVVTGLADGQGTENPDYWALKVALHLLLMVVLLIAAWFLLLDPDVK